MCETGGKDLFDQKKIIRWFMLPNSSLIFIFESHFPLR